MYSSSTARCLKTRMERFERRIQEHHIRTMLASQAKHDEERDMYDFD